MNLDFAKVCGKHNAIYEAYYKQIDPKGSGAIEAMVAAKFLKKSGLSDVVLSRVWDLSDPNGKGFLDKPGFFVALKLVSLAQAGQVVNMSNIYMETANPPKVGDLPKIMPPRIQTVPVTSGGVGNGDWSIGVIDRLKYEQLFESQKPIAGKLPGNKVKGLLMESKLPMDTLGKIWDLADQDKDGNLDKHEFIVAMHLVYQTLEKRTVPDVLPPELRKPGAAGPPPKPAPPAIPGAPMPRAPSGEGFGESGFVANFPKDIAPPPVVPPIVPPLTRVPPVGASVPQPLISTDPLIPIGAPISSNVEWVVTPSELIRYEVMFRDSDRDKDGLVSGLEVKNIFLQSGVAQQCLAHIWALCDTNQSGKLTLEQFALAMWMVERKQKGIEPPQVLTANMVPPSMRAVIPGVDLQPQEPKPTYSNPELEMISKEIEELAKERRALETEIAQKEADIRIKSGEVRSLQSELDTLSATLKQLENQRGEAQKRLDDLKSQVNKIREQCQKQEDTINEQEGELNAKRSELQKLKDEETALQNEYDENNRELTKLTNHLQNTQLQISSIRSMVTQLMETQRQMTDALLLCRAAIENQDGELVSEYQLKIEPDFDDARKTLERKFEEPKEDAFEQTNNRQQTTSAISNGYAADPFAAGSNTTAKSGFDDSFNTDFSSSGFDAFGSGFGQTEKQDPFGSNAFTNKPNAVTPDPGKDDFGSDPFAALHAPTGPGQVLSPNTQKSGPPPRPESPSPALPPKKSKVPPPRPAPPRPLQGPSRTTPQSTADGFGSTSGSGGFADFADFDNKLAHIPPPLPTPLALVASSTVSSGSTTPTNKMLELLAPPPVSTAAATTTKSSAPSVTAFDTTSSLLAGYSLFSEFPIKTVESTVSSNISNSSVTLHTTQQTHATQTSSSTTTTTTLQSPNDTKITSTTTNLPIMSTTTQTLGHVADSQKTTITTARKTAQLSGPTDFKDDPFKDYRYEDPFSLKDPFADDDDIDVFADPNKVFKDDLSSDDDEVKKPEIKSVTPTLAVRQTPIGSDFLDKFDAFTLSASPVSSQRSDTKSKSNTPVPDFDNFANFDAFSTTVAAKPNATLNNNNSNNNNANIINNKNDGFFEAFNDNFELNDKNSNKLSKNNNNNNTFNSNLFDAFDKITPTAVLEINNSNKNKKNNNSKQVFDAFDAFATTTTTTTTTKSEKLFEDDFNDNSFGDNFFNMSNNNNNNMNNSKNKNVHNFDDFDGGTSSFVADFNTALNNSKNFNGSSTSTLTKVKNKTTLTKLENSNAGKLPDKFANDFSQPDTFEADLEEALRRSMIDQ